VPLHISVRFDEGKIVLNTFSNGEWGKEERKSNPIHKGKCFMCCEVQRNATFEKVEHRKYLQTGVLPIVIDFCVNEVVNFA
jgi:hypothetical protein